MRLTKLTIEEAAAGLRQKKFSVAELVQENLDAIAALNPSLHAYLEIFEDAREEAKRADEILQGRNSLPPLFGIPLAIKDNILIKGRRVSAGSKMLESYTASYDATVIKKLKAQGAIFLGRTNLDEFAMGSSTENSAFGPTKNPHDLSRVPGGSSGGSAAAVAAHLSLGALGSDTGGSIRQPASFCGIVGFKPSYGAVSRHGLIAMASSLDQIGTMTKTVGDASLLFAAIQGKDSYDATATGIQNSNEEKKLYDLKKLRIGLPKEYFAQGLDPSVAHTIQEAIKRIEAAGATIVDISLPHTKYALACYYIIVPSEISANLARFDGIRYGMRSGEKSLEEVYAASRAQGFGPEVKRRIMLGTYTLSAGYYDAYYLKAQKVRRLVADDFAEAFKNIDVIAGPTVPTPPFRFGERTHNPLAMYLADVYTVAVNLAGVPAISIPAPTGKNLPVGLHLIGQRVGDETLLRTAEAIEEVLNHHA